MDETRLHMSIMAMAAPVTIGAVALGALVAIP